jgi:putative phosphoribosyl transferase
MKVQRERMPETRESGQRSAGRKDEVGRSGVYPASGSLTEGNGEPRGQTGRGQGRRGPEAAEEHGSSGLSVRDGQVVGSYAPGDRQQPGLMVEIAADNAILKGDLHIPAGLSGAVLFAHGSGSSRSSPRNQFVARALQQRGMATLLLDLLTEEEEARERQGAELRFDIGLLTRRLRHATEWLTQQRELHHVKIGLFGASTGAAAALATAVENPDVAAVVSRGGRPDMAASVLEHVHIPVLLIVGSHDRNVLNLNRQALVRLPGEKKVEVIGGASHLFEESGALEQVAQLAGNWFGHHLGRTRITTRAA